MRVRLVTMLALCCLLVAACGASVPTIQSRALGWSPTTTTTRPITTITLTTSPDGGIYSNPDPMAVIALEPAAPGVLSSIPGLSSADRSDLQRLGRPLAVVLRITNNGAAESDPQLDGLQVAADYAPPAAKSGHLAIYYHPTIPLALLSDASVGTNCSVAIQVHQTVTAVLLYPPVTATGTVVWGSYGEFAYRLPIGSAPPALPAQLHVEMCPRQQPA